MVGKKKEGDDGQWVDLKWKEKDYFTNLVKQITEWGSDDWGEVTFDKSKCEINLAGLSGLVYEAPMRTVKKYTMEYGEAETDKKKKRYIAFCKLVYKPKKFIIKVKNFVNCGIIVV